MDKQNEIEQLKSIVVLVTLILISGCATPPRWLSTMYDNADPCQTRMRAKDYKMPSFCGKGKSPGKVIIYDYYSGHPVK